MSVTQGVVVYTIERNGCLNGCYTRSENDKSHEQYNEIARKKESPEQRNEDPVAGDYICSWINIHDKVMVGELKIEKSTEGYQLTWIIDGQPGYSGIGFLTGEKQLTVAYAAVVSTSTYN